MARDFEKRRMWGFYEGMHGPEAELLDESQTEVFRVFLLAIIHSHLTSTAFPWDLYFFKLTQTLTVSTVQLLYAVKEKGGKPDTKPFLLPYGFSIHTETSSLRALTIMPINLNEIVHSWIWLQQEVGVNKGGLFNNSKQKRCLNV